MVKLNKIYTRTGDNGTTGLVTGPRRSKSDLRVDAYGSVDEAMPSSAWRASTPATGRISTPC